MPELTEELEGMGKVADMIDNDSDPAVVGESAVNCEPEEKKPLTNTGWVRVLKSYLVDWEGSQIEMGFEHDPDSIVAHVHSDEIYPLAALVTKNEVDVRVWPEDKEIDESWDWGGNVTLYKDEWEWCEAPEGIEESESESEGEGEATAETEELSQETASEPADRLASTSPMSPEEALREFQAYVSNVDRVNRRLIDAQQAVYLQESVVKGEKDELKRRQERVEAITSELSQVCAAAPDPKRYPLFDKGGKSDLPMVGNVSETMTELRESGMNAWDNVENIQEEIGRDDSGETDDSKPADDAWRAVQIEQLGLSQGLNDKFRQYSNASFPSGIKTMGDYCTFLEHGFQLTDIKGIGKAAVTKIEDAWEAWWGKQNISSE